MRRLVGGVVELARLAWRVDRRALAVSAVLMVLEAVALPLASGLLGAATDAALAGRARDAAVSGVLVAVLAVAALTAGHFAHVFYFELGDWAVLRLEEEIASLAQDTPGLEHHERAEYADRLHVLRSELKRSGWGTMQALLQSVGLGVALVITGLLLARLNPWLLLLPVAALPPLLLGRRAEDLLARGREGAAPANRRAAHLLALTLDPAAAKELIAGGLGRRVRALHREAWDEASRTLWRAEVRADVLRTAGQLVFAVAYVGATLLVVRQAVAGRATPGDIVLVITLAAQVNQQVTTAVTVLQQLARAARSLEDLAWLRRAVGGAPTGSVAPPERLEQGIALRGVGFTYPGTDRVVLEDLDLDLPAGTTVAVVGENGAGKSTLVKLLCRFYRPTAGTVTVDGTDLAELDARAWSDAIAAGFQDFCRFELLARENVGVGDLPVVEDAEAVHAALVRAHSQDVVGRLEDGLETPLGASLGGRQLSGGQWQKLALGRAMMRRTPLLVVLDEPTSALDAQAEHDLYERYAEHAREVGAATGAVTVLVSHRFSTVRMADLILVVAGSRVVERGSHAELVALGGTYAELFGIQASAYR